MPEMIDHIAHLSQEIGPRPAGTEEEQAAASYIAEAFQKDSGLEADVEDFTGVAAQELPAVICAGAAVLLTLFSMFLSVLRIPALIITLAAAVVFVAEAFGFPVISRFLGSGVSQNVVARYIPQRDEEATSARRRKIVFVTRYDSGKVRPELSEKITGLQKQLNYAVLGGMVALPVFAFIRTVFLSNAEGAPVIFLNILSIVALLLAAIPIVVYVLHQTAQYNDGANGSASGVAALIELAARVRCSRQTSNVASDAYMHGEDALLASGLVPEGAELSYAAPVEDPDYVPQTEAERLAAAKAAIAGLTGKPVAGMAVAPISGNLVNVKEPPVLLDENDQRLVRDETREALSSIPESTVSEAIKNAEEEALQQEQIARASQAAIEAAAAGVIAAEVVSGDVPDWFIKAQLKANRAGVDTKPAQRSRYAAALDAAAEQSTGYFDQVVEAEAQMPVAETPAAIVEAEPMIEAPVEAPVEAELVQISEPVEQVVAEETAEDQFAAPSDEVVEPETASDEVSEKAAPALFDVIEREVDAEAVNLERFANLPSFLNPLKVQKEAQTAQDDQPRTSDRVSVTVDPSASTGRILVASPASSVPAPNPARRAIQLPDVRSEEAYAPVAEMTKQRAPLADGSLQTTQAAEQGMPDNRRMALRSLLPSLSGAFAPVDNSVQEEEAPMPMSEPVGLTGSFAPISEELMSSVNPEDIYVDDADDSAYGEEFAQTGAFVGAGYVDMPTSRASKFFSRFRKKKAEPSVSAQEWLNVDEDFDARTVGKQRGSWESFRQEEPVETFHELPVQQDSYQQDDFEQDEYLQGDFIEDLGATTALQPIPSEEAFDSYFAAPREPQQKKHRFPWQGGAFGADILEALENVGGSANAADEAIYEESKQAIHEFHSAGINTEVWFVALGAELEGNAGMKAFLDQHADELRGAIIVDVDSLGAGDLCLIDSEGAYKKVRPSSRMKRFLKKASQVTGVRYGSAEIHYQDSAASVALKNGNQAIHLAGMTPNGKPAFFGEANDTVENIDAELLEERVRFLLEFVKAI